MTSRLLYRVFDRAAVTGMQGCCDKDAVGMGAARKRHGQTAGKSLLGSVIGVLAPCQIAEPTDGPMTASRVFRKVGKQWSCPLLQVVAVEPKAALAPADRPVGSDQRIRYLILGWNMTIGIAFAQSQRRKDDQLRSGDGHQLAQDQCR